MSDLIDRQAAIEALGEGAMVNYQAAGHNNGLIKAIDVIKGLPSVQPEQWIPCSERLPSKADHIDNMVLVCYGNGSVRFNTYMNGWVQGNPVAWMPLPESYRGDEDGK